MIAAREQDVHWTGMELVAMALEKPAPTFEQVVENLGARDAMRAALLRQMRDFPVLLLPACGVTSVSTPHAPVASRGEGDRPVRSHDAAGPLRNLLGLPALVIPVWAHGRRSAGGHPACGRAVWRGVAAGTGVRMEEARGPFAGPRDLRLAGKRD